MDDRLHKAPTAVSGTWATPQQVVNLINHHPVSFWRTEIATWPLTEHLAYAVKRLIEGHQDFLAFTGQHITIRKVSIAIDCLSIYKEQATDDPWLR
jgi:hypothetical protein